VQYPGYAGLDSEFRKIQFRCDVTITQALANQTINWAQRSHLLPKDTHEVNLHISGNRSYTLTEDCLCQQGRGDCPIAGHIRRLGRNLSHHLCAHVLERVLQLDLFATVTPSVVMMGAPNFFSMTALRLFGPKRDLYGVGQNVDAAHNRLT
jgi:hypothetical protein